MAGLVLWAGGCGQKLEPVDPALTIELRWIQGFSRESRSDVETGLLWTLSFLGAMLPRGSPDVLSWQDDTVTLRLDRAGIDAAARPQWERLLALMKASDEYRRMGALDIGRFVALTLCSPWQYYALTGANPRYEEARAKYAFDPKQAALIESTVAHGDRLVELARGPTIGDLAFVGQEGTGSIRQRTFQRAEQELIEVMPNGQLRFALYGVDGGLKPAASPGLTAAGKPSKCLWCHESQWMSPLDARSSVEGFYSPSEFTEQVATRRARLRAARAALRSRIDFARAQDHTYAELLYLTFYEPSAERLAGEWSLPLEQVQQMLSTLPTHAHQEHAFLGASLYRRAEVDALAPYDVIEVPTDPREASAYEPNLLR
jgi:hypothetical protein